MIKLRPYQDEALKAIFDYWQKGGGNPLVEMATGTGKSMVIAKLVRDIIESYPAMRVVMLTHVKELVEQNFVALKRVWPDAPAGVYSAGLGKRDIYHKIIFASIQSVFRKAKALAPRHLILIDEAHLVSAKGEGMYRQFLDGCNQYQSDARVVGFTATPYRLDSGRLDAGSERLFDKIVYSYDIGRGIEDGFLSPLMSKASVVEIDVSKVEKRGGEFVPASLEAASDRVTLQAVEEIIRLGETRKSWLIFCAGVKHSMHLRDVLRGRGICAETVTGETPQGERDSIIRRFKAGEIRALTNANVLTTGFDAPQVDLIAMLRPTLSTGLYVQMVGRGTRLALGKENCLVLDFAGNVRRHGPVDAISIAPRKGGGEGKAAVGDVRAKTCPECKEICALNARLCKGCGYQWPVEEKPKHEAQAEREVGILSSEKVPPVMLPVVTWTMRRHEKQGSPDSVRVSYLAGVTYTHEWIAFEHGGYASQKAEMWWRQHGGQLPFPKTVTQALERRQELRMPVTISVKKEGKYHRIANRSFAATQEAVRHEVPNREGKKQEAVRSVAPNREIKNTAVRHKVPNREGKKQKLAAHD